MYDNIAGKIKAAAKVICWLGIICSVIFGIAMIANGNGLALLGVIIIVIGSLASWVSSFALYGFGRLIENTDQLVLNAKKQSSNKENQYSNKENPHPDKDTKNENITHKWLCRSCGKLRDKTPCPYCGNE